MEPVTKVCITFCLQSSLVSTSMVAHCYHSNFYKYLKNKHRNKNKKEILNKNIKKKLDAYFTKLDDEPVSYTHLTLPTIYSV